MNLCRVQRPEKEQSTPRVSSSCGLASLFVGLSIVAGGCVSVDGDVLRSFDESSPIGDGSGNVAALCGDSKRIADGPGIVLGGVTDDATRGVAYRDAAQAFVVQLDETGTSTGAPVGVGSLMWSGTPRIASGDNEVWLAVQNHAFAGTWRVYLGEMPWAGPMEWGQFDATSDPSRFGCFEPQVARGHGELGVAHRCDSSIVFSRFDLNGQQLRVERVDGPSEPPVIQRLRPSTDGWLVLSRRNTLELERFSSDGAPQPTTTSFAETTGDIVPPPSLGLVLSEGSSLRFQRLNEAGEIDGAPAVVAQDFDDLRVITSTHIDTRLWVAWADNDGVWTGVLRDESISSVVRVSETAAEQVALLPGRGSSVLVLHANDAGLDVTPICI